MQFENEIAQSVGYLSSAAAAQSLAADSYWPKWDSPWWHMLLLHEMGHTRLIPASTMEQYIASLNRLPLKIFPFTPEDLPPGTDPYRGSACHCQLGNVYQVLATYGVDVDAELPWIRPWFLRYQMADGGFNCDNDAYLVRDECPSSMVGTIAAFEAVLIHTRRPWTTAEASFISRGARFLIERELRLGSSSHHNASERTSAQAWMQLCFPRFYLYDVLRGLNALVLWAEKTRSSLPAPVTQVVVDTLSDAFGDGPVRIGRRSFEGASTIERLATGEWRRSPEASLFPLLSAVSAIGVESPFLTEQWRVTCQRLAALIKEAT
jgi:hypothetical protein